MKKVVFLNAGHFLNDPGAISNNYKESIITMDIRDILIPKLVDYGFEVESIPDTLNLSDSISWVKDRATNINDGLALSLHCNCCNGDGAEAYYYGHNAKSKSLATKLLDGYIQETGLAKSNGGVRSDTTTRFGELGWIRKTPVWAVLLEMIYIDNEYNVNFLLNNKEKIADGIVRGVMNIYGLPYNKIIVVDDKMAEIKKLAQKIIDLT